MIDFVIRGTPRSLKAKSKGKWQQQVQNAVPAGVDLLPGSLRLRIDFFFNGSTQLDTDNIIKPIQDALVSILYDDDRLVTDVCARKVNLLRPPALVAVPAALSEALAQPPSDFVFVRVARAHNRLRFS